VRSRVRVRAPKFYIAIFRVLNAYGAMLSGARTSSTRSVILSESRPPQRCLPLRAFARHALDAALSRVICQVLRHAFTPPVVSATATPRRRERCLQALTKDMRLLCATLRSQHTTLILPARILLCTGD